jgi:hypothetical protein
MRTTPSSLRLLLLLLLCYEQACDVCYRKPLLNLTPLLLQ